MKRRTFISCTSLIGAGAAVATPAFSTLAEPSEGQGRIQKAKRAALAMQRRDWEQGILAQAMLEAGDREMVILLTKAAIVQKEADGRLAVVVNGGPTDPAMGGAAYAKAAEWTADPQIKQAVEGLLEWIRHKAPRNADGILYHVFGPEIWSDGLNCAPPFLAAMGLHEEALKQIEGYRLRLWSPEKRLLSHMWDDAKQQFKRKDFWGGGNGWAAAGMARVIRSLPKEQRRERGYLAAFVQDILEGCLAHQRNDGLFHDVIDDPSTFIETNLAQMLAFAIYEGVLAGWLPQRYLAQANCMRDAARKKMDALGYVQDVCGAPHFDRSGTSTEAQAFCIMMEAAGSKVGAARPAANS